MNNLVGRVVYSNAGRDKESYYIIIELIDENYVYIADGTVRKVQKPKKKKLKHLHVTDIVAENIMDALNNGETVSNSTIKKFLLSNLDNKEV